MNKSWEWAFELLGLEDFFHPTMFLRPLFIAGS
jgi:hypothetical protein